MRLTKLIYGALLLSLNGLAGPETINLHIDLSYCTDNNLLLKSTCQQIVYNSDKIMLCNTVNNPSTHSMDANLKGEAVIQVSGLCNGRYRECMYHFKPSLVRNARYPDEVFTAFPNGQSLNTTLIREELTYLKVECQ